jgi:hypothetical protein
MLTGEPPGAVFTSLAVDGADYRDAALAVCAAAGVPGALAVQRWADTSSSHR